MAEQEILNVRLGEGDRSVVLLDQSQLPNRVEPDMVEAIQSLRVRGAPAIGIFAGYCLYVLARQLMEQGVPGSAFLDELDRQGKVLVSSRPTAVNLAWAVGRLTRRAARMAGAPAEDIVSALGEEARDIRREDEEMCQKIAEHGLSLLKPGDGVLTHCNAGPLATSKYGTALGPILLGRERGIPLKVFADETRPLLQGARLTAWELQQAGVDAANGDAANKIGTSGVAILARHYGVPFYVLGPTSTIDWTCPDGAHIPIEERDGEEIRSLWYREPMAPAGVKCYNPAFDVTDHTLISGIVTEYGVCRPPFSRSLKKLFETISSK